MRVRLVRVRLSGGETEVLATSVLDAERLPRLFAQLYHKRWGVEEHYKRQKRWAEIENFSGRSLLAIRQDIHAKILAMNLAAMVRNVAQLVADRRFAHRVRHYQVRACTALSAMKNSLVRLLFADPDERRNLLALITQSLSSAVEAVRARSKLPAQESRQAQTGIPLGNCLQADGLS